MIIKYFAWLKNITNKEEEEIFDDSIKNINGLKHYLIAKYPNIKKHIENKTVRFAINLEYTIKNKKIQKKDVIAIFPPVSGG
mgnify:CR=1 FL=1|tara:strand:- start:495 stop:740 length:246 start_codon:yes stop_codon:yes gene_type:complete